jgi:hypothetical protein
MSDPIRHGDEWWTQGADGTWARWNATEYRWDPQPGAPPFAVGAPPPPSPPQPESPEAAVTPSSVAVPDDGPLPAPSGTAPAAGPPVPAPRRVPLDDFEPADGKARVASVFVGVVTATAIVRGPWLLQRALSETGVFESSPALAGISSFFAFAIVASAIAVMVWFKGAYDNAQPLGASGLRYTPGWAIGAWFIPVGNMFIPKQIADDIWRSSDPALPADAGAHWKFKPVATVLHVWWTAWVVRWVLTVVGDGMASNALEQRDVETYRLSAAFIGVSDLGMAAAGIAFLKVVAGVTARQRERARVLADTGSRVA